MSISDMLVAYSVYQFILVDYQWFSQYEKIKFSILYFLQKNTKYVFACYAHFFPHCFLDFFLGGGGWGGGGIGNCDIFPVKLSREKCTFNV